MNRTQIYLPQTQIEALRKLAYRKKISVSETIRLFIKKGLVGGGGRKHNVTQGGLAVFARRVNRLGTKGPRDLAERLNTYLYGGR